MLAFVLLFAIRGTASASSRVKTLSDADAQVTAQILKAFTAIADGTATCSPLLHLPIPPLFL